MTRQSSTLNTAIMLQQALEAPEGTVTIAINGREPGPHYPQDPHASELTRKGFLRLRVTGPYAIDATVSEYEITHSGRAALRWRLLERHSA
jgi:hypothetical protein